MAAAAARTGPILEVESNTSQIWRQTPRVGAKNSGRRRRRVAACPVCVGQCWRKTAATPSGQKPAASGVKCREVVQSDAVTLTLSDAVTRCRRVSPRVAECRRVSPRVAESRRVSPRVAESRRVSPSVAECRRVSPRVAESRRVSPSVAESRRESPSVAECRQRTPRSGVVRSVE